MTDLKDTKETKKRVNKKVVETVAAVAAIAVCIGSLVAGNKINSNKKSLADDKSDSTSTEVASTDSTEEVEATGITTYDYAHTVVTDKDQLTEFKYNYNNAVQSLIDGPTYYEIQTGNNRYTMYMYNTHGEIFSQSDNGDYTSVYRSDGSLVRYDSHNNEFVIGQGLDTLHFVQNAINAVDSGNDGITLYKMDLDNSDEDTNHTEEYRIDIVGDDAVYKCYESAGDYYASTMVNILHQQYEAANEAYVETTEDSTEASTEDSTEASTEDSTEASTEDSTEASTEDSTEASTEDSTEASTEDSTEASTEGSTELHMIVGIRMSEKQGPAYFCYIVRNGNEQLSWVSNAMAIGDDLDWKLDDSWYDDDKLESLNAENAEAKKNELISSLNDVLNNYAEKNNIKSSDDSRDTDGMIVTAPGGSSEASTEN